MNLLVEQSALLKATSRAASVVTRSTIPILNNVLLTADRSGGSVTATDLDMEIRTRFDADVHTEGQVTVSASALGEIARNAPKGAEISMSWSAEDPRLQVRFGRSRYQLPILSAGDFPVFSPASDATAFELPAAELLGLLNRTHFAMSTEETRYYLCGAYLCVVSEQGRAVLRTVATDGHRLALDETPAPAGLSFAGVILPRKTVMEFRRLLADVAGAITLQVSATKVALEHADFRLISKTVDGAYPDYLRVIPRGLDREILIDRELMISAVKRVALINSEKAKALKLSIQDGVMTLSMRNAEAGQAAEEIEVDDEGPTFEVGFNARYVLDALDQCDGKECILRLPDDPGSPARLDPHPTDAAFLGPLSVLMPLRV